jgi:hypothetical protein
MDRIEKRCRKGPGKFLFFVAVVKNGDKNGDRQKNGKNAHFPLIPIPFFPLCRNLEIFYLFSLFTNHEGRKFRDPAGQYMEKWTWTWTGKGNGVLPQRKEFYLRGKRKL